MASIWTSGYAIRGLLGAFFVGAFATLAIPFAMPLVAASDGAQRKSPTALESGIIGGDAQPQVPAVIKASAPSSPFTVRGTLALDSDVEPGDYAWNDEGVPAGQISIVVDIEAERIYVYRGGIEIGRSFFIYGADDKPTPFGTFKILQKKRDHISNLYGAPMPFMLRLTNDGIAIHGSETIAYNAATHGCIGLPDEFAELLFAEAKLGDPVLITKDWLPQVYGTAQAAPATI
jgi:lipoprotein-anchoring transpeptidase ErfK/SrfK